jgi:hypothetical protein
MEDSIYNHINYNRHQFRTDKNSRRYRGEKGLKLRKFQTLCIQSAEGLTLDMPSVDKMRKDFPNCSERFFRFMLCQFVEMFQYYLHCYNSWCDVWKSDKKIAFSRFINKRNEKEFLSDQGFKLHECAESIKELGNLMELEWTDDEIAQER